MQTVRVLAHLDRPVRLLFWSIDELAIMMMPFLIGIFSGSFMVILAGIVYTACTVKTNDAIQQSGLNHFCTGIYQAGFSG